jgi:DNA-binding transcriptional ArsR family regulator
MANQQLFQALADPTRRELLERLRFGPLPVGKLAVGLDMSRPAVSQHLRVLREAGLVSETREATLRYYRLEKPGFLRLIDYIARFCEEHGKTPEWTKDLTPRRKDAKEEECIQGS